MIKVLELRDWNHVVELLGGFFSFFVDGHESIEEFFNVGDFFFLLFLLFLLNNVVELMGFGSVWFCELYGIGVDPIQEVVI